MKAARKSSAFWEGWLTCCGSCPASLFTGKRRSNLRQQQSGVLAMSVRDGCGAVLMIHHTLLRNPL